jgi:hypothetical protein
MIQTCNDAYWENMPAVRDRTEGAPCGQTFNDVEQSTLCPHERLAPSLTRGLTTVFEPIHLNWKTAWPHALADVTAVKNTTDDPKSVTCKACLHAMGSQQHEQVVFDHERLAVTIASDIDFSMFGAKVWLACERDATDPDGRLYYQVHALRPDTYTGEMGEGTGGKAYLSPHMIEDELVQLAWGLFQAYVTHEAREGFTYKGKRIFGPHLRVANLLKIADDTVKREAPDA